MYYKNTALDVVTRVIKKRVSSGSSVSLFLEGVPGSGKTAFAKELAREMSAKLFRYDCSEESNSSLMVAYDLDGIIRREAAYIKGPLWEAFDQENPTILLVDEVDKSPSQFEAFLLRTTDEQDFRSPKGDTIRAKNPVVFVFTSNGRREMSPEFLRRCIRLEVEYPKGDLLRTIVRDICGSEFHLESQLDLLCHAVDTINGKVDADELPSPKEIALLLTSLICAESKQDVEVLMQSFLLKSLTIQDLNSLLSFSLSKALWKKQQ